MEPDVETETETETDTEAEAETETETDTETVHFPKGMRYSWRLYIVQLFMRRNYHDFL